jgi:hypothetical protein
MVTHVLFPPISAIAIRQIRPHAFGVVVQDLAVHVHLHRRMCMNGAMAMVASGAVNRPKVKHVHFHHPDGMSTKKKENSVGWVQSYVLRVKSGIEIPLNENEEPDPSVWTRHKKAVHSVKDYYAIRICGVSGLIRHFSYSTKTWFEIQKI